MKEKEGRIHALGTLTEKGFKVIKSAAGGHRSTFIVSENKPVIISTSSIFDSKKWQTHPSQATLAHYFFAYVLVHGPSGDIHIMPGEVYRKKVEEQMEKYPENLKLFIEDLQNEYKDNWKILR